METPTITPSVWRLGCLALAAALSTLTLSTASDAAATQPRAEAVRLEVAPGELGALRTESFLLLAVDPTSEGKELLLYEVGARMLHTFLESGRRWGDPIRFPEAPRYTTEMAAYGGRVVLRQGNGIPVFGPDGQKEARCEIFASGDLAGTADGWLVSLMNVPKGPGEFFHRSSFSNPPPRLVELDRDMEIRRSGLPTEGLSTTASAGAGRTLLLAVAGNRRYGAERASYRIYELGERLQPFAELKDPELVDAELRSEEASRVAAEVERQTEEVLREGGQELGNPQPPPPTGAVAVSFHYRTVIEDIAWDEGTDRLAVLLGRGVTGEDNGLDLIDPLTGDVRRFLLRRPPGGREGERLTHVAVGERYLWFRSRRGGDRTYRLDKLALLDRGVQWRIPELLESHGQPRRPHARVDGAAGRSGREVESDHGGMLCLTSPGRTATR